MIGRAIISTSLSKHWEAIIELMQADTNDRFSNMQIFAMLLSCIRKICAERYIGHLAMLDIEGESHDWYRHFFRLAGFSRCRCQSSAGSALQLETRNCLALIKEPLDQGFPVMYERIGTWLAEGRCTRSLLDSVASGQAAEVEHRYFHDFLAEIGDRGPSQGVLMRPKSTVRKTMGTGRPWSKPVQRLAARRTRAQQHRNGAVMVTSAYKVLKKRKQSGKAKRKRAIGARERHKLGDIGVGDHTRRSDASFVLQP